MMIPCNVEWHYTALLVTFPDRAGRSLLLQSDHDRASFTRSCGATTTDDPASVEFADCDPTGIRECPDDYLCAAEQG